MALDPFTFECAEALSIQGSLITDLWMEHMGRQSAIFHAEEVDLAPISISESAVCLSRLPEGISKDLAKALIELPNGMVHLCTSASPHHQMDQKHIL